MDTTSGCCFHFSLHSTETAERGSRKKVKAFGACLQAAQPEEQCGKSGNLWNQKRHPPSRALACQANTQQQNLPKSNALSPESRLFQNIIRVASVL
jgi:hypothetical protein